jgi:hypothetical protein
MPTTPAYPVLGDGGRDEGQRRDPSASISLPPPPTSREDSLAGPFSLLQPSIWSPGLHQPSTTTNESWRLVGWSLQPPSAFHLPQRPSAFHHHQPVLANRWLVPSASFGLHLVPQPPSALHHHQRVLATRWRVPWPPSALRQSPRDSFLAVLPDTESGFSINLRYVSFLYFYSLLIRFSRSVIDIVVYDPNNYVPVNSNTNDARATVMVYNDDDSPTITPPTQPIHAPRVSYASQQSVHRSHSRIREEPPPVPTTSFVSHPTYPPQGVSYVEAPKDVLSPQVTRPFICVSSHSSREVLHPVANLRIVSS